MYGQSPNKTKIAVLSLSVLFIVVEKSFGITLDVLEMMVFKERRVSKGSCCNVVAGQLIAYIRGTEAVAALGQQIMKRCEVEAPPTQHMHIWWSIFHVGP
jgi:hypothetical protein